MSDIRDAKVHEVDASSASVKCDNEGERVRARPGCARSSAACAAPQLLLLSNTDVVWIWVLTVQRVSPYVHVRPSDLCPTALKRKAKMFHLPVLHGSGVVRQSHAALQEDRKETAGLEFLTRHRNHLLSLPSLRFSTQRLQGRVKRGTPSIALLHKEVSGIQRHTQQTTIGSAAKSQTSHFKIEGLAVGVMRLPSTIAIETADNSAVLTIDSHSRLRYNNLVFNGLLVPEGPR